MESIYKKLQSNYAHTKDKITGKCHQIESTYKKIQSNYAHEGQIYLKMNIHLKE